jgi:hypothetical protein
VGLSRLSIYLKLSEIGLNRLDLLNLALKLRQDPRFRVTTGTLERSDPAQLDPTGTLEGFDPTLQRVGSGSGRVNLGSWRCLWLMDVGG